MIWGGNINNQKIEIVFKNVLYPPPTEYHVANKSYILEKYLENTLGWQVRKGCIFYHYSILFENGEIERGRGGRGERGGPEKGGRGKE